MPTRRGVLVTVSGALLLAGGWYFGYRELALLGALALVAVLAAVLLVGRPVRLQVRRRIAVNRVSGGDAVVVTLESDTGAIRRSVRRSLIAAEWTTGPGGRARRHLPGIDARTSYEIVAERRGVIDIGPLEAGRVDPLGLAATIRRYGGVDRVWVHPPVHRLHGIPAGTIPDPDGQREATQAGGLTFHGLREHVPGDDLRQVHWRSSARHGRLMVREYVDTSRPRVVLLVDARAADRDELDEVASAAASVLVAAVRTGLGCELRLAGGRQADGRAGPSGMLDLLAEMAPVAPEEGGPGPAHPDIVRACRLLRLRPAGDLVVLLGSALRDADLDAFGGLRDCYTGLLAAVIGGPARARVPGLLMLNAADAQDLAARWDKVREWL